jgi:hypothetical protein
VTYDIVVTNEGDVGAFVYSVTGPDLRRMEFVSASDGGTSSNGLLRERPT